MGSHSELKNAVPIFPVRDIKQAAEFYTQKLGFTVTSAYPNYLILKRDETWLHCSLAPGLDPTTNNCTAYVYVSGVEALYAEFKAHSVIHPNGALQEKAYGMKDFAVLDPDGNLLTFGESTG